MAAVEQLIMANLDIWSSAVKTKSAAGRGKSNKLELYGIKKLRELILELAVQGLLMPQDPSDEPASKLLKKIASEKAKLIKEGKLRKRKKLLDISEEEKVFGLPDSWEYARLNDVGDWGAGATPSRRSPELYGGDIPWFKSGELIDDYISESEEHVTELALEKASLRYNRKGDVLIAMYGATIGKASILSVPAATNQAVCACTPFEGVENIFLLTLLKAYKHRFIGMGAGGAQPNISREKIIATVVALPPTSEQRRIAAKVNELMALCDQLKQKQETSITAHQTLVQTLLDALTTASECDGFTAAWARIADHFDTLFTTEWSIDQLKQTILQLAVMGKLVPQDLNDEPVTKLLKEIAVEKAKLVKDGKIKKQELPQPIVEDEKPFLLPDAWEWVRLGELSPDFQNGVSSRGDKRGKDIIVVRLADIENYRVSLTNPRVLTISPESIEKYDLQKDDILIIRVNGSADIVGRFVFCDQDFDAIYCDHFIRMRFPVKILQPDYLGLLGSSKLIRDRIEDLFISTAGQKTVNQKHISSLLVSVPPIEEQSRIVAKVDELMALCDTLKTRINNLQTTQLQLADAMAYQVAG